MKVFFKNINNNRTNITSIVICLYALANNVGIWPFGIMCDNDNCW